MEKLVYLLWNATGRVDAALADQLLGPVAEALLALEPAGLAMNLADDDGRRRLAPPAAPARRSRAVRRGQRLARPTTTTGGRSRPCWLPLADRLAGYLVTESIPTDYGDNEWATPADWPDGERSPGVVMLTLMEQPERLSADGVVRPLVRHPDPDVDRDPAPHPLRAQRGGPARSRPARRPTAGIVEEAWPSAETVNDPMLFYLGGRRRGRCWPSA